MIKRLITEKLREVYGGETQFLGKDLYFDEGDNTNVLVYRFNAHETFVDAEVKITTDQHIICEFREKQEENFELVAELTLT